MDWGDMETVLLTYKADIKPCIDFLGPVRFPSIDPESTSIKNLQRGQNNCMRVITGDHKMASRDHLLAETQLLPVKEHLKLICMQFLASASQIDHPSNQVIKLQSGERKGRKKKIHTLQSRFGHAVDPYPTDGVLPEANYKKTISALRTSVVAAYKRSLTCNLLGTPPRDINPIEATLAVVPGQL
jgi:hypothetical protein